MGLKIISAGAGSGKTYRLSQEMVDHLKEGVRPAEIIATTFTKKAAAELQERVRKRLLEAGLRQEADELTNALIGTVHGLGVKLLKRFAYEAGVSPEVSIIAEDDTQLLFNQALANILNEERVDRMEHLAIQLGLSENQYFDWRKEVRSITEVARANNFDGSVLEESKIRSFESFQDLLGSAPTQNETIWDQQLKRELSQALQNFDTDLDGTKVTSDAIKYIKGCQRTLELKGNLPWKEWAKLGKLKTGAKSKESVVDLLAFARSHFQHPGFQNDIKNFIYTLFDIAIAALEEYKVYKQKRGLIDYTDMEVLVNELLDHPEIQQILQEELQLLMVDEFQDTSPIQLEIFLKLSRFAKDSIWVGDPKQSIYGFRGAAPELMHAILENTPTENKFYQTFSWRSREELVYMSNALFSKAFPDLEQKQIALHPKRKTIADPDTQNQKNEPASLIGALHHWHFEVEQEEGKKTRQPGQPWLENATAFTLKEMLETQTFHIWPNQDQPARPILPGETAILCRSNAQCQRMAEALHRAGLKASISRAGLLETAEAKLILACLKYLLNKKDSLSIAEILLLASAQQIETVILDRLQYLEAETSHGSWAAKDPFIQQLDELRSRTQDLSSVETLDLLLEEMDLRSIVIRWGSQNQRLDNIDRVRYYSQTYEEGCTRLHSASTLGGFLLWLGELNYSGNDLQASGEDPEAVNILTYHRGKGLEWPLVLCHGLDQRLRADLWGIEIVSKKDTVDLDNLLGNRWLRYWVNPYGKSLAKTHLADRIEESPLYQQKTQQATQEENRLLYVGLTRARDYLVFTSGKDPLRWLNRAWHDGQEDVPCLETDSNESPWSWDNQYLSMESKSFSYPKVFEASSPMTDEVRYWEKRGGKKSHLPFAIDANSTEVIPDDIRSKIRIGAPIYYGTPMLVPEKSEKYQIAKALKAFLVAYQKSYPENHLIKIAQGLVERYDLEAIVQPGLLVGIARNWHRHMEQNSEEGKLYRKLPIVYELKGQRFETVIDQMILSSDCIYILQNSGFPGPKPRWKDKVMTLSPWFYLVKLALSQQFPTHKIKCFTNFVMQGVTLKIDFQS